MPKTRRTSAEMYPLVEQYLQGHQRQKDFCTEHGISVKQLHYWQRKYREQSQDGAFLKVAVPSESPRAVAELICPNGVCLRLFVPVSASFLGALLQGTEPSA